MEFTAHDINGQRLVEGAPGEPLMRHVNDVTTAIEACFEHSAHRLLLYPENLTARFFDLSSGDAGEILQKLRNYRIRLAVVRTPTLRLSSRFGELLADEQDGPHFRLFDERAAAQDWLAVE
jgi:hypothetical protein